MTTTTSPAAANVSTSSCPATGRSVSACIDQTHTACWAGRSESVAIDLRLEADIQAEMDRQEP